ATTPAAMACSRCDASSAATSTGSPGVPWGRGVALPPVRACRPMVVTTSGRSLAASRSRCARVCAQLWHAGASLRRPHRPHSRLFTARWASCRGRERSSCTVDILRVQQLRVRGVRPRTAIYGGLGAGCGTIPCCWAVVARERAGLGVLDAAGDVGSQPVERGGADGAGWGAHRVAGPSRSGGASVAQREHVELNPPLLSGVRSGQQRYGYPASFLDAQCLPVPWISPG